MSQNDLVLSHSALERGDREKRRWEEAALETENAILVVVLVWRIRGGRGQGGWWGGGGGWGVEEKTKRRERGDGRVGKVRKEMKYKESKR